jgi:ketosteroid isomerase-like protein
LIALCEPDAISLPPTGDPAINTTEARWELFGGMLTLSPKVALNVTRTLVRGDTAMVTGSWTLEGKDPDNNPVTMEGHYADVVRRQADGSWLIIIDNPLRRLSEGPDATRPLVAGSAMRRPPPQHRSRRRFARGTLRRFAPAD